MVDVCGFYVFVKWDGGSVENGGGWLEVHKD